MNFILYIWMVVAVGHQGKLYEAWVPSGEYESITACQTASIELGVRREIVRCLNKHTGSTK